MAAITISAIWILSCKEMQSETKVAIGVGSGELINQIPGAPNISKFTHWLAGFKVSDSYSSQGGIVFSDIAKPEDNLAIKDPVLRFITKEITRLEAFIKFLEKPNKNSEDTQKIKDILQVESEEVYDLIMTLLDKNYTPPPLSNTGIEKINDFALFIKLTDNEFSIFFAQELLGAIFKDQNSQQVITGLEAEKDAYFRALIPKHLETLGDETNIKVMRKSLAGLNGLQRYLNGGTLTNVGGAYQNQGLEIVGLPAAFIHFHEKFRRNKRDGQKLAGAPNIPLLQGKLDKASKLQGDDNEARSTQPSSETSESATNWGTIFESFYGSGLTNNDRLIAENQRLIQFHKKLQPKFDCKNMDLDPDGLIYCNYYGVYADTYVDESLGYKNPSNEGENFNLTEACQLPSYSFALVQYNHSPVQNQGREGACTAYGLIHALEATIQSVSPKTYVSASKLWAEYRRPYTSSALKAAMAGFNNSGFLTAENGKTLKITGENKLYTIQDIKRALACEGKAVSFASSINSSWFQSTRNGGKVNCNSVSTGAGHAYAIVGYDDTVMPAVFLIKNSWGERWGTTGYATIEQSCWNTPGFRPSASTLNYKMGK